MNLRKRSGVVVVAFFLTACGPDSDAKSPQARDTSTQQRISDPWTCDPADWCRVDSHTLDCPPGAPETVAYAWPTQGGGFCTQRFACGPFHPLCAGPIEP
ncbi:hypothetical protein OWM54_16830 [Myxococcus sp. MISCRS1]|uniref:hypothetical protein n=1 Tax=Myxococcus sp. MISCRS1 TaxID=2996786 RepID=UPI00226E4A6B|nr:hypothetical protein [Myxococcus sp. MISCRS1]MCY0998807.1 hypothetical protein [Myxococcus sp. MISCRS1]